MTNQEIIAKLDRIIELLEGQNPKQTTAQELRAYLKTIPGIIQ